MQRVKCLLPKKVVITQGNDHKRRNAEKAGTPSGLSVMINKRSKSLDVFDTGMKHNAWVFGQTPLHQRDISFLWSIIFHYFLSYSEVVSGIFIFPHKLLV